MPVYPWSQINDAPRGSYVGISHPDGRKVLTGDLDDPIVKVQRRVNRAKALHDPEKPPAPADLDALAAWLDTHAPAVEPLAA